MSKIRVLFVCLGNICRSPAAEGAFRKIVTEKKLIDQFYIDSAGTAGYHDGELAHPITRKVAKEYSIDLTHFSRKFIVNDFEKFDYIFAMDSFNYADIISMAKSPKDKEKVFLFRKFDPSVIGEPDVPDPYSGGIDGFKNVQEICLRTSEELLNWILSNLKKLN